jgi:acetyl coenzyme A synthetase (ADP forming)-like protein
MLLERFFEPRSVAIIGASRKEGSLGRVFFDSLYKFKYTGQIYPVNPQTAEISGIKCYQAIEELPEVPDVAVIAVRKEFALEAVQSCGHFGIKNIIMITAGFREVGGEGKEREKKLLKLIKKFKIRLIGPNCMGIINTDPGIRLNASFSPTEPYTGNVAFLSQSGALGVAVLEMSKSLGLGFSIFISTGNKADLIDVDFLEYLSSHKNTDVILLYQESIESVSEFRKIATNISRRKPIVALKAGRSVSGARAASSHTGALASSDAATDALFSQCGIIRVESFEDMFNTALAFSKQPAPTGNRVAVITNAGGPGILATDSIERSNLQLARLSETTQKYLESFLPAEASVVNPVDMIASADEITYQKTLKAVLKDTNVDAVFVIIVRPPKNTTPRMIAEGFKNLTKGKNIKPVYIILMSQRDENCGLDVFQQLNFPVYHYPESVAKSVSRVLSYQSWRKRPQGKIASFKVDRAALLHIFETAQAEKREYLSSQEINSILVTYHFPISSHKLVQSAKEAVEIFERLKNPIVLKIESDEIIHKSDIGGVQTNLNNEEKISRAFEEIMERALKVTNADKIAGILVQEMVPEGREVALGMKRDPNYGPIIMFGMGGIFIETFHDVCFRMAPVSNRDALEMIESVKGYSILRGIRGEVGVHLEVIVENIQRLSQLALNWPEIEEIDLNPFIVAPHLKNCKIVDARIRINVKK